MSILLPIPPWVVEATLRGSAAILAMWLLRPLVRQWLGARATHWLWLVVLVQLLVPWLPKSPLVLLPAPAASERRAVATADVRFVVSLQEGASRAAAAPIPSPAKLPLFTLWALGVVACGALAMLRATRATRLVRRARVISDHALVRAALAEIPEAPRSLRLCETDQLRSPALCGLFHPTILLPLGWERQFTPAELRCVLQHEIGHLRRGDLTWRWAFLIARALHWFNPLVWLAERSARADQEMACDEWVLARSTRPDTRVYGETLLKASRLLGVPRLTSPAHATMAQSKAGLTRRIRYLAQARAHGWRAAIVALVLGAVLFTITAPPRSRAQAGADTPPLSKTPSASAGEWPSAPIKMEQFGWEGVRRVPKGKAPHVEIEAKFVEITSGSDQSSQPSDLVDQLLGRASERARTPGAARVESVLESPVYEQILQALNQKRGVDVLSVPGVTTRSGQRAVVEITREFRYPTQFGQAEDGKGTAVPTGFETRNTGVTLEVEPKILPDGRIELMLIPQVVEFLGFVNYRAGQPARSGKSNDPLSALMQPTSTAQVINQPIFETRKLATCVVLQHNQTALVGGMDRLEKQPVGGIVGRTKSHPFWRTLTAEANVEPAIERSLLIFVTARLVNAPREQPGPAPGAPALEQPDLEMHQAMPVPGRAGFVTSPYAPAGEPVDVRDLLSGTQVKCSVTGKIFLVP